MRDLLMRAARRLISAAALLVMEHGPSGRILERIARRWPNLAIAHLLLGYRRFHDAQPRLAAGVMRLAAGFSINWNGAICETQDPLTPAGAGITSAARS